MPVTTAFAVVDEMTNASEIMEPSGENKNDNVLNFRKKKHNKCNNRKKGHKSTKITCILTLMKVTCQELIAWNFRMYCKL